MELISPRRQILRSIGLVVLIILLLLLLVDFEAIWEGMLLTDWWEYAFSVGFLLVAYALLTLRTRFLLEQKLGYFDALYADSSGFMFSILMQLPNTAFRALAFNRSAGIDASTTTSALTVEVLTGWLGAFVGAGVCHYPCCLRFRGRPTTWSHFNTGCGGPNHTVAYTGQELRAHSSTACSWIGTHPTCKFGTS